MQIIGVVIELVLWFYILFLLARLVADYVQMFARSWEPKGFILVLLEFLYSTTDPPIKLLRRLIPPIRLGGIALDQAPWLHAMWDGKPAAWFVQWELIGHAQGHVGEMVSVRDRLGLRPF